MLHGLLVDVLQEQSVLWCHLILLLKSHALFVTPVEVLQVLAYCNCNCMLMRYLLQSVTASLLFLHQACDFKLLLLSPSDAPKQTRFIPIAFVLTCFCIDYSTHPHKRCTALIDNVEHNQQSNEHLLQAWGLARDIRHCLLLRWPKSSCTPQQSSASWNGERPWLGTNRHALFLLMHCKLK